MKTAFQKGEPFLNDVRQVVCSNRAALWWLGQSGFLFVNNGRSVVFDPYLSDSLSVKYANTDKPHVRVTELVVDSKGLAGLGNIDLVTSSHNHTDHLDTETLLPLLAANPQARLILPAANRAFVLERLGNEIEARLVEVDDGSSARVQGIDVHGVASAHPQVEHDELGRCRFLGYVCKWDSLTVYHSGDTLLHEGLASSLRRFQIDVAMLPINGDRPERRVAGNLDGTQAAQLAKAIGARIVIPCHFDLFEFNTATPDEFVAECKRIGQGYHVLRNGERLDLPL